MRAATVLTLLVLATSAQADPGRDEAKWRERYQEYERTYGKREYKEKFASADGCEVERKWKKGEYEEKVKCKGKRDRD